MKKIHILCAVLFFSSLIGFSTQAQNTPNTLTLREVSGQTQTNRVVSFGRPFKQGEFPQGLFPQAVINGNAVLTQVDVKNRHNDGSLKFAIISFVLPSITANQDLSVSFQNSNTANNNGYLDAAGMLGANFNFDAQIRLSNGASNQSASARTMLQNNHFTYWLRGPVVTAVILTDHSTARPYDLGFDTHRSFRPIFHAYFHPSSNEVKVSFIGEASNTEAAQNVTYNLSLTIGQGANGVYSKNNVNHIAFSRWIKRFSINPVVGEIEIDMNTRYLVESQFLPNYDTQLVVPQAIRNQVASTWAGTAKDLYDKAFWQKHMPSAGGRGDIGPHTDWASQYVFSWDHRLKAAVLGNADLAAAWPKHFREGRMGKRFDRAQNVNAVGLPMSLNARPSLFLFDYNSYMNFNYTQPADQITLVGGIDPDGWNVDCAHQPEVYFIPYITTGEYWYLEQLQMWAAHNAFATSPYYGRGGPGTQGTPFSGPRGAVGEIGSDQIRGQAWSLRTRALAGFISPDGTPEKDYFDRLMVDAIAVWEGELGITSTPLANTPEYQYGFVRTGVRPTLKIWRFDNAVSGASTAINTGVTLAIMAPWEYSFLLTSLGRSRELGYPTERLVSYVGEFFIGAITDPAFNPYHVGDYQIPARKHGGAYFSSYAETATGYVSGYNPQSGYQGQLGDVGHGYPHINRAAFSYISQEPGGNLAWAFVQPQTQVAGLNHVPKWAINPRASTPTNTLFLASLQPNAILFSQANQVTLTGQNFSSTFEGLEINGVNVPRANLNLNFVSSSQITWNIAANQYTAGTYPVRVINPGNVKSNALNLVVQSQAPAPSPQITVINPTSIINTATTTVTISGSNFDTANGRVRLNNVEVPMTRVNFVSASSVSLIMPAATTAGSYYVTVVNGDLQMSNALPLTVTTSTGGGTGGGSGSGSGTNPGSGSGSTQNPGSSGGGVGGGLSSGGSLTAVPNASEDPSESGDIAGFGCSQGGNQKGAMDLMVLALVGAWTLLRRRAFLN